MGISFVIVERIPAIIVVDRDKSDECGTPPTVIADVGATRTPCPVPVVKDTASVVIRGPTPWLISHPGPTVRRTPNPVAISIRRPIGVDIDGGIMWLPDPTVIGRERPIAICVEILSAPNILVVILRVVAEVLSKITL